MSEIHSPGVHTHGHVRLEKTAGEIHAAHALRRPLPDVERRRRRAVLEAGGRERRDHHVPLLAVVVAERLDVRLVLEGGDRPRPG